MPSQPSLATGPRRAAVVLLLVALVGGLLAIAPVSPAGADSIPRSQFLQWSNGTSFISTGANAGLTIDLGRNAFVGDCPSGFPDVAYSQTDIYIVPSGSVSDGATLQDVSGTPNTTLPSGTVWGGELIGYTAPTGDVGEGDWAVVYDECQNGKFEADTDALFDPAIRVSITADVPPLPGIDALKAAAHEEALIWADFAKDYTIFLNAAELLGLISGGTGIVYDAIVYMAMGQIGSYLPDVKTAAIVLLLNNAKHYAGIAADPPDPEFEQPTTLVPRPELEAGGDGPMLDEVLAVAEATASEAALAEALLHSMERYQGADQASDGDWALVHARQLQDNARLLGDQMAHTSAAVDGLLAALDAQGGGFESHVAQLEALRSRVVADGYSDAELRAAAAAGIPEAELDSFRTSLAEEDFSGFTEAWVRALLTDLKASHAAMPAVLDDVALAMQPIVDWLVDDPGTEDLLPVVLAGGPYTGEEGIAIPFDASASTSATPITSYEWDLDADGEFDDATGATPSHTFTEPFDGLIGVRISNAAGANVGYTHLTVVEQDSAPTITSATPATTSVRVTPGATQAFAVTATDAEGQPTTTTWLVDGVAAGTGAAFDYHATAADLGLHTIAAVVSDGSDIGGSTTRLWSVIVQRPDEDGDGWADNVDCDDTDPGVNPGAHEVIGNGVDDDCDPGTSDAGSAPTVTITPPGEVVVGEAVAFAAEADDADGDIVGYAWDFGDGGTSDEAAPSHTFAAPGARTVSVTVTDEQGDTTTDTIEVTVLARPVAAFTTDPVRPQVGEAVELTDASTDADGTIDAWSWDFGDGTTSTEQHPTRTFTGPGTHEVRLTVTDDDGLTATITVTVRVAAPGVAAFTTAKLREGMDGVPGAGVMASSVFSATTTDRAANAIDGSDSTYWRSAVAPAGDQDLRFSLPSTAVVDQLRLSLPGNANAVRGFQLQLSTTGTADADFTTVLTAEAAQGPGQLFAFPPTSARFARLVVLSNHGGTTTQVGTVSLTTRDREGGIVSLGSGGPTGAISQVSSEYTASQGAKALIDGSATSRWRTVAGTFPQSATVDLATQSDSTVDRVVLTGLAHASSVRAFEIQVATSADPATFTTVVSGELPMTATPTTFTFPATAARRVRVVVQSSWGETFSQLGELAVLDGDGVNVALATASSNATVIDASSQVTSTPARNAIDNATGTYWGTPSGVTGGDLTVRLRDARSYLVDHVDVRGNTGTSSVRDVEIQVSNTTPADDAFVTVASGAVPRSGQVRSFTFPAVEARYVRLVATTNHGGANLQVNDLRVWSPTRGGEVVAFDDLSSVDGTIATWAWSFGDGTTSSEQHPVHAYAAAGTYTVSLTVTDTDGHSATTTMPYTVVPRPQAAFTWTPAVPGEQTSVAFQDASTPALSWRYSSEAFSSALTGQNPNGVFPDDGSWPVTLEIVDAELRTASTTTAVTVSNRPPTANAGTDRTLMWRELLTVDAHVGDPSPRDATSLACDWDFGDGETAHVEPCNGTTVDVAHAYPHPGTYTATLTVSDGDGGVTTDSRQVVATTRPSFVQVVDTETLDGDVVVTVRALDGPDVFGIAGVEVQVAHGGASVAATTDADGFTTATLPRDAGVATVEASFAGNASYDPAPTVSKDLLAAPGDIVFIIDESGSMSSVQEAVRRNLFEMSRLLGEQIDFRIGIVGFGGRQMVEIHLPLTDDLEAVHDTLEALVTTGSFEPGYHATVAAMSDAMGYRAGAGACGVLIGDELPQRNTGQATLQDAIAAVRARGATMFGIVSTQYPEVAAGYGPEPGSLTYETGGDAWPIAGFPANPGPVLDALLDQCVTRIIAPGVGVAIAGTPGEVGVGGTVDYTVTVDNDSPGPASGVELAVELPAGLSVQTASDDGSVTPASGDDPAVLSWPAFTLDGGASTTRTFTARVVAGTPAGPLPVVATVTDDGARGPDRDPSDNTATAETVVLATRGAPIVDAGPDVEIEEGSTAEVAASFVDPDGPASSATHSATIDWGAGPTSLSVGDDGGLAPATAPFDDDATATVEVCVTDDDGLEGCDTTTVTVTNAAPVLTTPPDATVDVGSELVVGPVAFVDAGPADTHVASVGFGDGSDVQPALVDASTRTITIPPHTYASAGEHQLSVCMADDDAAFACTTTTVTVVAVNEAPVADAGDPQSTVEGTPVVLDASGSSDPDGDVLTYRWDLDDDGAYDDATGPRQILPAPDDAVMGIGLEVTDPSGLVATDRTVVTVTNAAPVIGSVEAVDDVALTSEGELVFVVNFTDAGLADTHRAVVDVEGRQIVVEGYTSGTPIVVPVSQAGCTVGVEVEIHDDDGDLDTASTTGRTVRGTWLSPLRIDGSARRVEAGQVLPVKVRLEACSGSTDLQPSIRVRRGDGVTRGGEMTGDELVLPTVSSSQTHGVMRRTGNHFQYDMRLDLAPGTWTILVYPTGTSGPSVRHLLEVR